MRDWMVKDAVAWLARPPQQGQHSDVLRIGLRKDYPFHYTTSHLD